MDDRNIARFLASSSLSAIGTMLQTTNIVCHSVYLTDELKIGLEYDIHGGLLNIFVKNTGRRTEAPCQINVLAHPQEHAQLRWDDPSPSKLDAGRCRMRVDRYRLI